jgi:hypothetical protein
MVPSAIATLATGVVIDDIRLLLASLQIFNQSPPTIYLFCDKLIHDALPSFNYTGSIITNLSLTAYTGLDRAKMERMPGKKYKSLFFDFTMEKIALLRWALEQTPDVMFCDADICFLGPLPVIPTGATLALSQHMIRSRDEDKFGRYNAGFMWFSSVGQIDTWEAACADSRFFEQAALEDILEGETVYPFPITQNYGWWRLWQSDENPVNIVRKWTVKSSNKDSGICISNMPLGSVHTHFKERRDDATRMFNEIVIGRLRDAEKTCPGARKLLAALK